VVTSIVPITATPAPENTTALQTILTIMMWTLAKQPGMELLPIQQQAYSEKQVAWIYARQIDTELRAAQHQDELIGDQATLDAQLTELHWHKAMLGMERAAIIEFIKAQARARAVTATINHEGMSHPTFAKASQNVAAAATLLDTLLMPSTDGVRFLSPA
jgi:hypothetical protein